MNFSTGICGVRINARPWVQDNQTLTHTSFAPSQDGSSPVPCLCRSGGRARGWPSLPRHPELQAELLFISSLTGS